MKNQVKNLICLVLDFREESIRKEFHSFLVGVFMRKTVSRGRRAQVAVVAIA